MFNQKILFLLAIYISALFASNLLGMKTMPFLFGTHLSVAVFFLPFVFVTIDIVGQVYGPSVSRMFVRSGFIALVFFLLANILSEYAPWSENTYARIGESYDAIFSLSFRVGIASLFAFLTSELIDVWVFFRAKQIFSNFFIASTLSNIVSQWVDTFFFMVIAFAGVFSPEKILLMSIPWWIYKVLGGVAYTPISYFILSFLSRTWSSHR